MERPGDIFMSIVSLLLRYYALYCGKIKEYDLKLDYFKNRLGIYYILYKHEMKM